ncbi:MAG: TrkA family potassium uptake protein [Eubacteriales bacterium]|nr:TrkA family potassium uptake protein [Eubacteriales bacterium]
MKSVLVIGLGRFGLHLAHKLAQLGNEVMVVDQDAARVNQSAQDFADAQIADCTDSDVLRSLGVGQFDVCFVAIFDDFESSLVITSQLRTLGAKTVVSVAKKPVQASILKKIGANEVICPEQEIAEKTAVRYNAENIFDYVELTAEYSIYEIAVPQEWIGKNPATLDVRRRFKVNIVAIQHGNSISPLPGPDYIFDAADHLMVLGRSEDVFRLAKK